MSTTFGGFTALAPSGARFASGETRGLILQLLREGHTVSQIRSPRGPLKDGGLRVSNQVITNIAREFKAVSGARGRISRARKGTRPRAVPSGLTSGKRYLYSGVAHVYENLGDGTEAFFADVVAEFGSDILLTKELATDKIRSTVQQSLDTQKFSSKTGADANFLRTSGGAAATYGLDLFVKNVTMNAPLETQK